MTRPPPPPLPAPSTTATGGWLVLLTTLAIQAMVSMAVLAIPAVAPAVAQSLGVSATMTGVYIALVYVGAILASLMAGQCVARYGAIRVSQAGLLLCAAGLCLSVLPSVAAVAAGAVLIGMGYGPITPASSHLLAATTPPHRAALIFSIKQTGVPLGGVMAGAIVPTLVLNTGIALGLFEVALACVACALAAQPLRRGHDADRRPDAPLAMRSLTGPLRMVFGHPQLKRLASLSFVFSMVQLCLATYIVTHLHSSLGYSLVAAGFALSVAQAGGVAGRILWGWIADRFLGARRTLMLLAAMMALCTAATGLLPATAPLALVLVLLAAFGASATGWNGVYLAEVARLAPPGMAGTATGGSLSVTFFGVVLGPAAFGAVSGLFGSYSAGYLALAVPTALCCWGLFASARGGKDQPGSRA
ncbi:MAG: major facilitator superfamily 1 [Ramlibacter sp.]|uniref:MFS transporter n=1 Tax=Ramlibacter sp. TaxID=1917967 RepID=UPI002604D42D|nr:MFS transporter [Ramlibacter sp.]MDB5751388.1 major facilitator superfamily 1 [Ramlibacter sp.]